MGRSMKAGAKGIKTSCSGRLGGADMARTEFYSKVLFRFRHFVQILIMDSLRQTLLMVRSALRYGSTKEKYFLQRANKEGGAK